MSRAKKSNTGSQRRKLEKLNEVRLQAALKHLETVEAGINHVNNARFLIDGLESIPAEGKESLRISLKAGLDRLNAQYIIQVVQLFGAAPVQQRTPEQEEAEAIEELKAAEQESGEVAQEDPDFTAYTPGFGGDDTPILTTDVAPITEESLTDSLAKAMNTAQEA